MAAITLGYVLGSGGDAATTTQTSEAGIPAAVEEARSALLAAAESGHCEALRRLIPSTFRYTFGGPVEGGPMAYWRELERSTEERPLETLAAVLRVPYALSHGTYFWPWAYTVTSADDLSKHERELLAPLGRLDMLIAEGTGYVGWRAGIAPDGTWVLFVAGD